MKISIIIPIYNALPYLPETLDSVLGQKDTDMEVLLVDDGSTDGSGSVCQGYSLQDFRIRIIQKINGGLSSARNAGLEQAKGEYIWFVDADDLIIPDSIERMAAYLSACRQKPDILFSNALLFSGKDNCVDHSYNYDLQLIRNSDVDRLLYYFAHTLGNIWSVWGHLYSRSFLMCEQIRFDETVRSSEDFDWLFKVILKARNFDAFPDYIYKYRMDNQKSIHKQIDFQHFHEGVFMSIKWFHYFYYDYTGSLAKPYLLHYMADYYRKFGGYIPHMAREDRLNAKQLYTKHAYILNY